jgi:hypothetical protein
MGESMSGAALKLFDDLDVRFVPTNHHRCGPMETHAVNVVDRLIHKHGLPHATLTLRTIVESDGNQDALVADIIEAVSDIIRFHPRWSNLGLELLGAFDKIDLIELRRKVKAAKVQPLRVGISTLICVELEKILGPAVLPKPPKPVRGKREPKPPAYVARVPGVERNVALGLELLKLRSAIKSNREYGRQVRIQFDAETKLAVDALRVAKVYGARPEIYTRLSWNALVTLASPALPAAAREALEARICAGERIGAPEIRAASGALKACKRGYHHAKRSVVDSVSVRC